MFSHSNNFLKIQLNAYSKKMDHVYPLALSSPWHIHTNPHWEARNYRLKSKILRLIPAMLSARPAHQSRFIRPTKLTLYALAVTKS